VNRLTKAQFLPLMLFSTIAVVVSGVRAEDAIAPHAAALSREYSRIVAAVGDAVVHIATVRVVEAPPGPEELLREFFGRPAPDHRQRDQYRQQGLGSGVIVSDDGYILTNSHVVQDATRLTVVLGDQRRFEAQIIGVDAATDLAVVKIDAADLTAAPLGDSDALLAGNLVLAIGSPFGLTYSVSAGIVSATGRVNIGIAEYEDFIQTDAAINPGNSGGPLVNMNAQIVGINTAIVSRTGGFMGLGFAVPINLARSVMQSIITSGRVIRGWLGVSIQDLTPELAAALNLEQQQGALISDIIADTPAAAADLQRGDLVVAVNGDSVASAGDLRNLVARIQPGTATELTVVRNGQPQQVQVVVGERPRAGAEAPPAPPALGLQLRELTDELRQRLDIDVDRGVFVSGVRRGSQAALAGIRPGMVIVQVNRQDIDSVGEFHAALAQAEADQPILLLVSYRGATNYVLLRQESD